MNIYWFVAFVVYSSAIFGGGVYSEHRFDIANQFGALTRQIAVNQKAQEQVNALAGDTDAKLDALAATSAPLEKELDYDEISHPSPCAVPAITFSVLFNAAKAASGANL